MFLTVQNCLFRTLFAVCDPALELYAHSRCVREIRTHGSKTATCVRNKKNYPVKHMAHITAQGFIRTVHEQLLRAHVVRPLWACERAA